MIRYFAIFLIVGAALAQAPSTPAPAAESAGLKSVGTMKEIMVDLIFPTSNEIFYVSRNENKSPKDWMDLQQNALIVAEVANLLMAENRARDKDRWMKDAKLLQDVGVRLIRWPRLRIWKASKVSTMSYMRPARVVTSTTGPAINGGCSFTVAN